MDKFIFSISKFTETTQCIRGNEFLTSILNNNGVAKLWLSCEHVFVSTKEDHYLYVFDVVPQLRWRKDVPITPSDYLLDASSEVVIDVLWDKSDPSFVFVVFETGTTHFWEFLRPSRDWIKRKTIQLSNAFGSQITKVQWHQENRNLVWCEKRGFAVDAHCVCYRSITVRDNDGKVSIQIGSTQAILHNCPAVDIFSFNNGICIHPRQICLEKILMFWTTGRNLQAVVLKSGRVQESVTSTSDFRDILMALAGVWTQDSDHMTWIGITVHPSRDLLLLNKAGVLVRADVQPNIVKSTTICRLSLPLKIHETNNPIELFVNEVTIGVVNCNSVVFLYDLISGKLLQTLEDFTKLSEKVQVFVMNSREPAAIFWTSNDIWKLSSPHLTELVKTVVPCAEKLPIDNEITGVDCCNNISEVIQQEEFSPKSCIEGLEIRDVVNWLCVFGLKNSAILLLLEHIILSYKENKVVSDVILQLLKKLGKDVLQNPAILTTFFEQDLALKEESMNELKHFLEEVDQAIAPSEYMTPLSLQILPFLRELFETWNQQMMVPSLNLSKLTKVFDESVKSVIDYAVTSVATGMQDALSLEKYEILCLQEPEEAVKAFLGEDENDFLVETEDTNHLSLVLRAELNDRKWRRCRNPENATILGALFRVLYKRRPEKLLHLLQVASMMIGEGASKDEATQQDLKDCVRDFMLDFLPNVWREKERDIQRINVHAQLLLRLGLHKDALEVYLQRQLWHEAVQLYVSITRPSTTRFRTSTASSTTDVTRSTTNPSTTDPPRSSSNSACSTTIRPWEEITHLPKKFTLSSTNKFEIQLYQLLLSSILRGTGTNQSELLTKIFELKPDSIEVQNVLELCLLNTPETFMEGVFKENCTTVGDAKKSLLKFFPKSLQK